MTPLLLYDYLYVRKAGRSENISRGARGYHSGRCGYPAIIPTPHVRSFTVAPPPRPAVRYLQVALYPQTSGAGATGKCMGLAFHEIDDSSAWLNNDNAGVNSAWACRSRLGFINFPKQRILLRAGSFVLRGCEPNGSSPASRIYQSATRQAG